MFRKNLEDYNMKKLFTYSLLFAMSGLFFLAMPVVAAPPAPAPAPAPAAAPAAKAAAPVKAPAGIKLKNPISGDTSIPGLIAKAIKAGLSFLGALALIAFMAGGFIWLTSGGASDKTKTGLMTIAFSIIGLFVVFLSYGILSLLFKELTLK